MKTGRTENLGRRVAENVAMAALMTTSKVLLTRLRVADLLVLSGRAATTLRWTSLLRENTDTLARGRALAYRWSRIVPGCSCLHRAASTQVWLGGFHLDSRVVLGIRRRDELEGHAWLEVYLPDAATLLFIEDDDGYPTELPLGQ